MKAPTLTLYTFATSPFGAKVEAFLNFKGLEYDTIYVNPFLTKRLVPVGHQIPVLTIGEESRADSTPIGLWLEECYPAHPTFFPDGASREEILAADRWVSDVYIPMLFYSCYPMFDSHLWESMKIGWRLGARVRETVTSHNLFLPSLFWPLLLREAPFIKRMLAPIRRDYTKEEYRIFVEDQLASRLERGGGTLCGTDGPSLADLSLSGTRGLFQKLAI